MRFDSDCFPIGNAANSDILRHRLLCVWSIVTIFMIGCGDKTPLDLAEVAIEPGVGWSSTLVEKAVVPGKAIAAWSGPEGASLAVVSSLPIPNPNAEGLTVETATRWLNFPGYQIVSSSNPTYSGLKASRVDAIAQGFGNSLAPIGTGKPVSPDGKPLIATRCVSVSFPRGQDTLTLLWYYPESAHASLESQIEAALKSLKLTDRTASSYNY